jgi:hydrogenase expression/formation protein HypE
MREKFQKLDKALANIEKSRKTRQGKFYLKDKTITLSHGSGGTASHNLIDGLIGKIFSNELLDPMDDSAILPIKGSNKKLAFTTDSYVVSPIFFPGGNIGELAVNGTVNDLAVSGAEPLWLSVSLILEEGFAMTELKRIIESMQVAAEKAGVQIVTGDTKVVPRGSADKIFINTSGIGIFKDQINLSSLNAKPGDKVLLSGPIGDHGVAVMLAREALDIESNIQSDTAPLNGLINVLLDSTKGVHCLKDATRGGVATVLNEIAIKSNIAIAVEEDAVPIRPEVNGACEMLGLDPLTIANEGRFIAVVARESEESAVRAMRKHPQGSDACTIGEVLEEPKGMVFLRTAFGGHRVLDMLVGDPLPRIC